MTRYFDQRSDADFFIPLQADCATSHEREHFLQLCKLLKRTPLHLAMVNGDFNLAHHEVEFGANLNAQDIHGNTPLHLAVAYYEHQPELYEKIIDLLLLNGARDDVLNNYKQTALDLDHYNTNDLVSWLEVFSATKI